MARDQDLVAITCNLRTAVARRLTGFLLRGTLRAAGGRSQFRIRVKTRRTNVGVGVQLHVLDANGNDIQVANAGIGEPWSSCGPPPSSCPTFPVNPITMNLQNQGIPPDDNFNPNGSSSPKGKNAYKYSPKGFHISTVYDNWGQDISTPNPHWSPQDGVNPNPFNINYAPFFGQYPYDTHQVFVKYKTFYQVDRYNDNGTYHPNAGTWDWVLRDSYTASSDSLMQAQTLPECYDRGFTVGQPGTNATTQGAIDQPTSVSFHFSVPVSLYLPQGPAPIHNPLQVCGITYGASYYIKHANGSYGGPLPSRPGDGGGVPPGCLTGDTAWNTGPYGISPGTMQPGDEVCVNFSVSPGGDRMNENGTITNATPGVSASGCSAPMVNAPYFKVFNSGVSAGGDFSCGNNGGVLAGYNDNTGADRSAGRAAQCSGAYQIDRFCQRPGNAWPLADRSDFRQHRARSVGGRRTGQPRLGRQLRRQPLSDE